MKFSTLCIEFIFVLGALVRPLLLAITQPVQRFSEKKVGLSKLSEICLFENKFLSGLL